MEMENYIIKKLKEFNREYVKIDNPESLEKIYNLWKNGIPEEAVNSMEYLYFGLYHQIISI